MDFAIPFLDEDLPLCVDPFLLWRSPSMQDNSLHTAVVNSFNYLGHSFSKGQEQSALTTLVDASECDEVGLGNSATRSGKRFGLKTAKEILSLYRDIPQITKSGFVHFEEIQLFVDNVAKDRISDITCNFLKSFLIDYTISQCNKHSIPMERVNNLRVYNYKSNKFVSENVSLPCNPISKSPILLVPKRWLRYIPWINYDDYFKSSCVSSENIPQRVEVLNFNRKNYGAVKGYIEIKEKAQRECKNDPLFEPIPVVSAQRKYKIISALKTGKTDKADQIFEETASQLLASLLYPDLDFAKMQSRTDSGVLIRDLIFYSNISNQFLKEIYDKYSCRQIVIEMKNVAKVDGEHVNQLNRYLNDTFGNFGIILTRNAPEKSVFKNTIDLWSGQRKCILILCDDDLEMMCQLFESRQRIPLDVIKKKYVEFTRLCPG